MGRRSGERGRMRASASLLSRARPLRVALFRCQCAHHHRAAPHPYHQRATAAMAASSSSAAGTTSVSFLSQKDAIAVDEALFSAEGGFSVDQLMELAGLSVACAIAECYPRATHPRVLIFAGPGNNGGDGLVVARHLHHFGYESISVCYPKRTDRPLYHNLVTQIGSLGIPIVPPEAAIAELATSDGGPNVVVDAILAALATKSPRKWKLASVDIPSGWAVESGRAGGVAEDMLISPDLLVSLTAPKLCAQDLDRGTHHYLGGRFVPPFIRDRYGLELPEYKGASQCV